MGEIVMPGADWRSESAYREVGQAETADMAWEWLRRDREYQKAFTALASTELSSAASDDFRRSGG
ncbi:transcriptional regulator domain-containing protein [Bradyrhizobium sp. CCBAU 11445]|uniref:transcriptional regulator domain-containing protein n=1 Tax=Bradyrhizobium sp. CCBAU 11445 TaxID=1630896 RepID=UPI003FA492B6